MDDDGKQDEVRRGLESRSTEELVSILRNQDSEEWEPEVFGLVASILAERGLSPEEVRARGPEGYDVVEGQKLVTVARCFSPVEAHVRSLALREAGLQSWVADEVLGAMYGVGIGSRLQVRAEDETAARAVLQAATVVAADMPPELAEPPCPACGSNQITQAAEVADPPPGSTESLSRRVWRYRCGACGHAWSD